MSTKKNIEFFFFKKFIKIIIDFCIFLDQIIVIHSKNKSVFHKFVSIVSSI